MQLLQAKNDGLRANLLTAQSQLEQSAVVNHELGTVKAQIDSAGFDIQALPAVSVTPAASPHSSATPASGRASPSQISPFQSAALELPISFAIDQNEDPAAAATSNLAVDTGSEPQSANESSADHNASVATLRKENTALKSQLEQLTQREAAEEADVTSLQAQNKELIADLGKLRGQIGEVGSAETVCYPMCVPCLS